MFSSTPLVTFWSGLLLLFLCWLIQAPATADDSGQVANDGLILRSLHLLPKRGPYVVPFGITNTGIVSILYATTEDGQLLNLDFKFSQDGVVLDLGRRIKQNEGSKVLLKSLSPGETVIIDQRLPYETIVEGTYEIEATYRVDENTTSPSPQKLTKLHLNDHLTIDVRHE